jgi:hypothetical protein
MANEQSIQIPSVVWYDKTSASPAVSATAVADLQFVLQPGRSRSGPSVALLASYKLAWPYVQLYSYQLPKPVLVGAIDASSGKAYVSDLNIVRANRQQDAILLHLRDQEANAPGPVSNIPGVEGCFNVDLAALLGLPPEAGFYQVFLWLDDLVTPIQTVQVPADPNRAGIDPSLLEARGAGLVTVQRSSLSPAPTAGEIRTDLDFTQGRSYRVYATLPTGALDTPPTGGAPGLPALTILAFDRQNRLFQWATAPGAYSQMTASGIASFDLDPFQVVARPATPTNVYVLTVLGALRNEVLPIFADYLQPA